MAKKHYRLFGEFKNYSAMKNLGLWSPQIPPPPLRPAPPPPHSYILNVRSLRPYLDYGDMIYDQTYNARHFTENLNLFNIPLV